MAKGKPGSSPLLRPHDDAMSLHSRDGDVDGLDGDGGSGSGGNRHAFFDADDDAPELFLDNDDLPPLYSDVVHEAGAGGGGDGDAAAFQAAAARARRPTARRIVPAADDECYDPSLGGGPRHEWRYAIGPFATAGDTAALVHAVEAWSRNPPRPYVQVRGTHSETVDRDGKKEKRDVVDFDVRVELTPYLYVDAAMDRSHRAIRTPHDRDRVRRGTVFPARAPGAGPPQLGQGLDQDREPGDAPPVDGVEAWCRRYCADPSPLRSFQLERRMTGFDATKVRTQLEALVRRSRYRGHLSVTFPVDERGLVYYSDHRFNRWRLLWWAKVLCVLTLTILFTWPYLFFRTKRYEVITVEWPFSQHAPDGRLQYTSVSEDQWYNLWARAIQKAVLSKRQATLNQEDLRQAEGAEPSFESTGNASVDGALGLVQAGISAMNQVNRQLGWGADS